MTLEWIQNCVSGDDYVYSLHGDRERQKDYLSLQEEVIKMVKKCPFCGNIHLTQKKTQYLYKQNEQLMVVNDVPCLECDYCGEEYFWSSVLKKIEKTFFEVSAATRNPGSTMEVPVERFAEL